MFKVESKTAKTKGKRFDILDYFQSVVCLYILISYNIHYVLLLTSCNTESPFSVRFITRNEKSNYLKTNQQLLCMTSIHITVDAGLDFIAEPLMYLFNNYIERSLKMAS